MQNPELWFAGMPLEGRSGHEAGRELLAQLYERHTGQPLPPIRIAERGKPYFPDSPLHFSISHTKRHVFCAIAPYPLGLDAEEMDRKVDLRFANKILSPGEQLRLEGVADKRQGLLRLWVLKEAAAKCSGEGLRGYPNHTDFSPDDPRVQVVDGCFVAIIENKE